MMTVFSIPYVLMYIDRMGELLVLILIAVSPLVPENSYFVLHK